MNKLQWNFNRNSNIFIQENAFESVVCEMAAMLSRPQCVNMHMVLLWLSSFQVDVCVEFANLPISFRVALLAWGYDISEIAPKNMGKIDQYMY